LRLRTLLLAAFVLLTSYGLAHGDEFEIVAKGGDPIPGFENATYNGLYFGTPVIDDTGAVYFTDTWTSGSNAGKGLFVDDGSGPRILFHSYSPLFDQDYDSRGLNDVFVPAGGLQSGVVLRIGTDPGSGHQALLRIDESDSTIVQRETESAVDDTTTVNVIGSTVAVDAAGRMSYSVKLGGTPGGTTDDRALFFYDPTDGTHRRIVTEGDPFPNGGGTFEPEGGSNKFFDIDDLDRGRVTFSANGGIFQYEKPDSLVPIVRYGADLSTLGPVISIGPAQSNAFGHVAFRAASSVGAGVFVRRGGEIKGKLSGAGAPLADGTDDGTLSNMSPEVIVNDLSEVIFRGIVTGTDSRRGLFLFDGDNLTALARLNRVGPGGGAYTTNGALCCLQSTNDPPFMATPSGKVLFQSQELMEDGTAVTGLYLYERPVVRRILAVGDSIGGFEVDSILGFGRGKTSAGWINDQGLVTAKVEFTDGTRAIVRTAPETVDAPSSTRRRVRLEQNVPNPFNPRTTLAFSLPVETHARLSVFDVSGRRIATLVDTSLPAGRHEFVWDGRDGRGTSVASGVYLYRLEAGPISETRRMVLIR